MSIENDPQEELVKLTANDSESSDKFGGAVAISGKYAIVGAAEEDTDGSNAGAAYIYHQNDNLSWTQITKLQSSDRLANDAFGCSVAISGDFAFVGANKQDSGATDAGCVYVFEKQSNGNWEEREQLQASDKLANDYFGGAVAANGHYLIVGAVGEDANATSSGAAYIFERNTDSRRWNEVKKLKASNTVANDNFGCSVSISGDRAIVGANLSDPDGHSAAGACYIFERNAIGYWEETQQLTANDKEASDNFGFSVSIERNFAIVGAKDEDNGDTSAGAAYIFERDESGHWGEKIKLQASDKQASNYFGCSVGIYGNLAVVGATGKDDNSSETGGAYLFKRNKGIWQEHARLSASDRQTDNQFGNAVAVDYFYAVVGMALSDSEGKDAGAAYLFETGGVDNAELSAGPVAAEIAIEKELVKLTADDKDANDKFGESVAISGQYAIVGAAEEDSRGSNAGAAYVFQQNDDSTWTQLIKLMAKELKAGDAFGCAVAISNQSAFVGAKLDDSEATNTGCVYLYERKLGGGLFEQKLQANDRLSNDYFGCSVAVSGNYAVIGANGEDTNGRDAGAAYIFKRNPNGVWLQEQKLKGSNTKAYDYFGSSVSISDSYVIIGSYGSDVDGATDAGSCYIFERNITGEWKEVKELKANDKKASDYFGCSVGIDGNYAVIGAKGQDNAFTDAGAAYVFERINGQWDEAIKLQASDKQASNSFGCAVSISGDIAVVGAIGKDGLTADNGGAYLFKRDNGLWTESKQLLASDRQASDQLGYAVAVSGDYAVVSSNLSDSVGANVGSAYLFETDVSEGPDLDASLVEGLICQLGGGVTNSGHIGNDVGSFVCDGTEAAFVKVPGIRNMKSIAMWVNIKDERPGNHYLLDARDSGDGEGLVDGYIYSNGVGPAWPTLYIDGTSIPYNRNNWDNIPKQQWTHIYVEAEQNFDESINFMSNYYGAEALVGNIDEIRIYDRALTPDEIKHLAES